MTVWNGGGDRKIEATSARMEGCPRSDWASSTVEAPTRAPGSDGYDWNNADSKRSLIGAFTETDDADAAPHCLSGNVSGQTKQIGLTAPPVTDKQCRKNPGNTCYTIQSLSMDPHFDASTRISSH